MKKTILAFALIAMITGSIALYSDGPSTICFGDEPGGGTGGGVTTWSRWSQPCPNNVNKLEYHCDAGGTEMCSITNC